MDSVTWQTSSAPYTANEDVNHNLVYRSTSAHNYQSAWCLTLDTKPNDATVAIITTHTYYTVLLLLW